MQCSNDDLYCVRHHGLFSAYKFMCSFIHPLSIWANVKSFVKDISETIKARSFKLGMQCSNDDLYPVRDNGLSRLISSFNLSFYLLSIKADVKYFVKDLSGTIKARSLKIGMQCNNEDLYHVRDNGLSRTICSFVPLFSLLSI